MNQFAQLMLAQGAQSLLDGMARRSRTRGSSATTNQDPWQRQSLRGLSDPAFARMPSMLMGGPRYDPRMRAYTPITPQYQPATATPAKTTYTERESGGAPILQAVLRSAMESNSMPATGGPTGTGGGTAAGGPSFGGAAGKGAAGYYAGTMLERLPGWMNPSIGDIF